MTSLPSSDDTVVGTNRELRISSKDETSALEPQKDETSSTSKTDYQTAENENSDFNTHFSAAGGRYFHVTAKVA